MKLQAKVNMRCFLEKNEYYEVIHDNKLYLISSCGVDRNQTIIFSRNEEFHRETIPYTVQVEMYIWDYFYKPIKLLRKEKLMRIEKLGFI